MVTATCEATVADPPPVGDAPAGGWLDFGHLRAQLPLSRVLDHLGLTPRLNGSGAQRRCACPIHRGDGRGRTFRVNLATNAYQCFDARCGSQGDVIDLWAALHQRDLRAAALDLVEVFGLEPAPHPDRPRNGWAAEPTTSTSPPMRMCGSENLRALAAARPTQKPRHHGGRGLTSYVTSAAPGSA